jgi:hypothetical protein
LEIVLLEENSRFPSADGTAIIPVETGKGSAYISVRQLGSPGTEGEIAARIPSFGDVVGKVMDLAGGAVEHLRTTGASKIILEFGCEMAIESGQLVAIVSKVGGKATFKVGLEWSEPTIAS